MNGANGLKVYFGVGQLTTSREHADIIIGEWLACTKAQTTICNHLKVFYMSNVSSKTHFRYNTDACRPR